MRPSQNEITSQDTRSPRDPTFVCKDCGVAVYDALGEVRERCCPCRWVADIADENERARVREWLIEVGAITRPV